MTYLHNILNTKIHYNTLFVSYKILFDIKDNFFTELKEIRGCKQYIKKIQGHYKKLPQ